MCIWGLLIFTVLVRAPFWFPDSVGGDESTLILMGQSVLNGQLPYTTYWDIKPPLAFMAHAIFIGVFGKSLVAIRLGGTLLVWLVACFCFKYSRNSLGASVGLFSALAWILVSVSIPGGRITMTETIAVAPLVGAFLILSTSNGRSSQIAFVGALMAVATLVRLNLAYVVVLVGLYILFALPRSTFSERLKLAIAYGVGGGAVTVAILVPYIMGGAVDVFYRSVFEAALDFSATRMSPIEVTLKLIRRFVVSDWIAFWLLGFGGTIYGCYMLIKRGRRSSEAIVLPLVFMLATFISVIQSGAAHKHYLIQVQPFVAIFAGLLIAQLTVGNFRPIVLIAIVGISLHMLLPSIQEYRTLISRIGSGQTLYYGSTRDVTDVLLQHNPDSQPIYLMTDHLAHWHTGTWPMSPASTHPSNIAKPDLLPFVEGEKTSPLAELEKILSQRPGIIVTVPDIWYLQDHPDVQQRLDNELDRSYVKIDEIDSPHNDQVREIYKRTN